METLSSKPLGARDKPENGLTPPTSAPGLGAPVLRRDWACPAYICTGTGRAHAEMECGLTHSMGACDAVLRGMRRACRLVQG